VNHVYPSHCSETTIEEFVVPVVETDPSIYTRQEGVSRVYRRRLDQLERDENPKRHDM
jgi:hypothetical protein